jgi:hypothetical protein
MKTFRLRVRGQIFEITIRPWLYIFGGMLGWMKAKKIEEDSNGRRNEIGKS